MKDFTVIACTLEDAGDIMTIERQFIECPWSESDLKTALSDERYMFFKAVYGGETVGYMGLERCLDEGNICNVAVVNEYRRNGIATKLIAAIETRAKSDGITKLFLEVNEHNDGAIALYNRCGFKTLSRRKNYYGKDAAIVMVKDL